jgi:hypothetical protein
MHWTLVMRVRQGGDIRKVALEELCRLYWYPIFDELPAEERYTSEPLDHRDPEWLFTRTWTQLPLESVRQKMRGTFSETGRAGVFEALLPFLIMEDTPPSYREVAEKLESSETAVRLLVFRMRSRFRELLRDEVARTAGTLEDVEAELEWNKSTLAQ